jgi:hypothetical protein
VRTDTSGEGTLLLSEIRSALRQSYREVSDAFETAIVDAGFHRVTEVELHADRLRISIGADKVDIPFDIATVAPPGGDPEFLPDHEREALIMVSHQDGSAPTRAHLDHVQDLLGAYYWIIEGTEEAGATPLFAIRRQPRRAILRALGKPAPRNHGALPADRLAELIEMVDDLREFEFVDAFLLGRVAIPGAILATMGDLREAVTAARSLSPVSSYLFGREQERRSPSGPGRLPPVGRGRVAGFFPGLGSRDAYQHLGRTLLDSQLPAVVAIYHDGAEALGFPGHPEKLLMDPENMPATRIARQGFIGAAFVVHNLALAAYLRARADEAGIPLRFVAYTGESFGIITAAVASGSLSVADGVRIARAFTPLSLVAAEGADPGDPVAHEMAAYVSTVEPLVPEPFHVVALRGEPDDLARVLDRVAPADVEVHKLYSARQRNVYVRAGARASFEEVVAAFPAVSTEELKPPTTFLAHSSRMGPVRAALARFIGENGIVFGRPSVPVVSNSGADMLTTAAGVRAAVLATADEVMASQTTVQTLDALRPDLILEIGLGHKSVRLLHDNHVDAPVAAYTGDPDATDALLRTVRLVDVLMVELARLHAGEPFAPRHRDLLRHLFRDAAGNPFAERYLARTMGRVITHEMLRGDGGAPAGFARFIEIYQHTYDYRDSVDAAGGELVLRARLKKRIVGPPERIGHAYAELRVLDGAGHTSDRTLTPTDPAEVVVFHFDRPGDLDPADLARSTRLLLDSQPLARRIYDEVPDPEQPDVAPLVYQYALFRVLRRHRPAMFAQNDCYVEGSGPMGWLVALAAAEAVTLPDAVRLYRAHLRGDVLEHVLSSLTDPALPVISCDGTPLRSRKDLEYATRDAFR